MSTPPLEKTAYPKITVITPSYNQGAFLEETIASIHSQNYPNLEHILIDGGSTDNSLEIIEKYQQHFTYWVSEPDKGQTEAINKGLKKATGDILTWINSDDLLLPNALHDAANYFIKNPQLTLIHGKSKLFGLGKEKITAGFHSDLSVDYYTHIPYPQPSSFFHRRVIDKHGLLDENLHYCMDYDLLLRIVLGYDLEKQIMQVDNLFSAYRLHEESKTVSQLDKFVVESDNLFITFLKSINAQNELALLNRFGISGIENSTKSLYTVQNPPQNLDKIIFFFLYRKLPSFFEAKNYSKVIALTEALQQVYPSIFEEQKKHLESIYQTSRYNSLSRFGKLQWKIRKVYSLSSPNGF